MTLADRVVVLQSGVIEQVGSPMELYDSPVNKFVAQFIGMPQMNIIPNNLFPQAPEGVVEVGMRPEHLLITDYDVGTLKGSVEMVEALGNETLIHVNLDHTDGTQIIVRQYEHTNLKPGEKVGVNCVANKEHFFDAQGLAIR